MADIRNAPGNNDVTVGGVTYRQDPSTGAWFRYDAGTQGWAWSGAPPQTGGSGLIGGNPTPTGGNPLQRGALPTTGAPGRPLNPPGQATPPGPYGVAPRPDPSWGADHTPAPVGTAGYAPIPGGRPLDPPPPAPPAPTGGPDPIVTAYQAGYSHGWAGANGQAGGWAAPPQTGGDPGSPTLDPTGVGGKKGPVGDPTAPDQPQPVPDWRTQQGWWGTLFPTGVLQRTAYDLDPDFAWNTLVNHNVANSASPEYQWLQQQQSRDYALYGDENTRLSATDDPAKNMTFADWIEQHAPGFHNEFTMQNASVKGYSNPFMQAGRFTG